MGKKINLDDISFIPKSIFLIFLISFYAKNIKATHIRAGEIIVERIEADIYKYRIRLIIYSDTKSIIAPGTGILATGDGTTYSDLVNESNVSVEILDNDIAKNTYEIQHTYQGNEENYTVSYTELNRNPGIINMTNSVNTPFYTETAFNTETPCTINHTPVLLIPPIDYAGIGSTFKHNPGAYDPDGDSITYELVIPRQAEDQEVANYSFPENLTLDQLSGEIIWQVPESTGEYNIAIAIHEWRPVADSIVYLSTTIRDMQIIVIDNLSHPPEINLPEDTCLVAGDYVSAEIFVDDKEHDRVKLESLSQVYLLENSPAIFGPGEPLFEEVPYHKIFEWQTSINHISTYPYKVYFKASDDSRQDVPLVDFKTWRIKVSATGPENVRAELYDDSQINLSWNDYNFDADTIQIYRRVVDYDIPVGSCITGIPNYAGYELVGEIDGTSTEFNDFHPTGRFARGAKYCYRLMAVFSGCTTTKSAASQDICVEIPVDAPVITNVSVLDTHAGSGQVYIRWTSSFDIDPTQHNISDFTYRLQRAEGFSGKLKAEIITPENYSDTVYVDANVNTLDKILNYTVYLYENGVLIDSSATASTIRLDSEPVIDKIGLEWKAVVPWSNNTQKYPYHYIYRNKVSDTDPESLVLIDSVQVNQNGLHFIDSGQYDNSTLKGEYCYYVTTMGSYGNPRLPEPLKNNSQIFCAYVHDTIPPCVPDLSIKDKSQQECFDFLSQKSCDFNDFFNNLIIIPGCEDQDVIGYRIEYSTSINGPFKFITNVDSLFYRHEDLSSFKGCYRVIAIDFSGNESKPSQKICRDNCPNLVLPNVFTPNFDGYNDVFTEYNSERINFSRSKCPRFIKNVHFSVYNRNGKLIYSYRGKDDESFWVKWEGIDSKGQKVPAGIYYYMAKIEFDKLDVDQSNQVIKGWVQVLY